MFIQYCYFIKDVLIIGAHICLWLSVWTMYSSRSGRRIKPTASNSKVVDILSKYDVDDSDEDSEDEEYEPAADDTECT